MDIEASAFEPSSNRFDSDRNVFKFLLKDSLDEGSHSLAEEVGEYEV